MFWDTGVSKPVISEKCLQKYIAQIRYTPVLVLDFPLPAAATSAQ